MSHNNNSTSANDPRQPSAAKPYVAQPVSPQDLPVDYSGFIAVIFGIAGVMFRVLPLPLDLSSVLEFDFSRLISLNFQIWISSYLFLQYKLSSWLAIIFCAQSLANMKNVENDLKQISMAMMLVLFLFRSFSCSFIIKIAVSSVFEILTMAIMVVLVFLLDLGFLLRSSNGSDNNWIIRYFFKTLYFNWIYIR